MHAPRLPLAALAIVSVLAVAGAALAQTDASVTFAEQTSDGRDVVVDEVALPEPGFVAVHDASLGDGNVLGSVVGVTGHLPAGTHQEVTAHLLAHLDGDQRLVAMPHQDTDGDATYSFVSSNGEVDGPFAVDGDPVTDDAPVTVSATVAAGDQPTDGRHVLAERVSMEAGGFVAIHDDRLLEGRPVASVVGNSSLLEPGVHEDVRIPLDQELARDQTLVLMPHRDSDGDGSYDFVTSAGSEDPPYRNHTGDAVVDAAEVNVTGTAQVTLADASTGGHVVDVDRVFVPDGGFVTIHDSNLTEGAPLESVRGTSPYLEPGLHGTVEVVLDDPLEDDDTLYAMPHRDTDDDETYDFVATDGGDDGPYTDDDGAAVTSAASAHLSASVDYGRQSSDGLTVTVDRADLAEGGFVTIHDASLLAGRTFGSVAGVSAKLEPGLHRDVEVVLDEPVLDSQPLVPMPHRDSDGDGSYDFVASQGGDDGPYVDARGQAVVVSAFTEVRASVTATDQTSPGHEVAVESATLTAGGFVVIHDASLLEGEALGSVVGTSALLDPGTSRDVAVALEENLTDDQTLYAMPHRDSDGDGSYDFVASQGADDGPYTWAGGAVLDAFDVTVAGDDGDGGSTDGDGNGAPGPGALAAVAVLGLSALAARRRGD